jgi:hypothetical protein
MDRRRYSHDRYEKLYDLIELIYLLNRVSDNSYIDDGSKKYLIEMLNNVESIKNNFDKYRDDDFYNRSGKISVNNYDGHYHNNGESFLDRIIFFLKSLND